jgi:phosphoglucosamine mutase
LRQNPLLHYSAHMKKYFGTDGIRGRVGETPITADWVLKLGWALGTVLSNLNSNLSSSQHSSLHSNSQSNSQINSHSNPQPHTQKPHDHEHRCKVLIGKDTRVSGYLFESALEAGLSSAGVDTLLVGPMPTPGIAYLTRALRASAGIVISASHNPYYDNGIKFFSAEGSKLPDDMELAIEAALDLPMKMVDSKKLGKAQRVQHAEGRYIEFCKNTFPASLDLQGIKLVLDCANGATYRVAPVILRELGAEVIEMAVTPDGYNINDHCGSTYPEKLAQKVLEENADLGIALDGDGDRLIMVDHQGEIVDGDELLFIIAKWYAETKRLMGGVVGTLMSNYGLELALKEAGIEFSRVAVGDRHIMECLKKNTWNLGGESSGHIICLDANSTGDGIVSALRVLAIMQLSNQSLSHLKSGMKKLPQTLINVPLVSSPDKKSQIEHPDIKAAVVSIESRLQGQGRVLLRASGTEPVVRVMVEGHDKVLVHSLAQELALVVQKKA